MYFAVAIMHTLKILGGFNPTLSQI